MTPKLDETKTETIPTIASLAFTGVTVKRASIRNKIRQLAKLVNIGAVSLMLLSVGLWVSLAYALPTDTPQQEKAFDCLGDGCNLVILQRW